MADEQEKDCPCEKLRAAYEQIESLNKGVVDTHEALNLVMCEYAKLHLEENAFQNINDLCKLDLDKDQKAIIDAFRKIKDICSRTMHVLSETEKVEKAKKSRPKKSK